MTLFWTLSAALTIGLIVYYIVTIKKDLAELSNKKPKEVETFDVSNLQESQPTEVQEISETPNPNEIPTPPASKSELDKAIENAQAQCLEADIQSTGDTKSTIFRELLMNADTVEGALNSVKTHRTAGLRQLRQRRLQLGRRCAGHHARLHRHHDALRRLPDLRHRRHRSHLRLIPDLRQSDWSRHSSFGRRRWRRWQRVRASAGVP